MDLTKKRKHEENGTASSPNGDCRLKLEPEDARKLIDRFTLEQLHDILQSAVARHADVLDSVRLIADSEITQRKLFIRGLGWETTTENLRNLFSEYGDLEEAIVILDKNTGKSKGYGFITFKHMDSALLALKEPSKKIDGRVTVTQLAAAGNSSGSNCGSGVDISLRKIYVANVPYDMPADKLLSHFLQYGEIEEGPLGFDKQTGKSRGFALFVYKTAEGAHAAIADPVKNVDGRQVNCKLAIEGKKMKPESLFPGSNVQGDALGMMGPTPYGGPTGQVGYGPYSGFSSGPTSMGHTHVSLSSSMPGAGMAPQAPATLVGSGVYGATGHGIVGSCVGYGGLASSGYGVVSGAGIGNGTLGGSGAGSVVCGAGGPLSGDIGSGSSVLAGSSLYKMQSSSVGTASGSYQDAGSYGFSSSSTSLPSLNQGTSPAPRVPLPSCGMYQNLPNYY